MTRSRITASLLAAAAIGLMAMTVVASSAAPQDAQDDKGAATFTAVCSKCHPADRIVATRRTRSQWEEILDKMTKLGAQITDDNYDGLMAYLLSHYGKINVNRGEAKDLAVVANISANDADAIVKYRTEHGDFTDFDALSKVPGIDVKALEEHKAALDF
ncbi:MAG TPA: helix-hairpin-helix domain-containing protein [Vicinamibacterales bacterium]|jgi:competence ComEA-like helix-hairpin-helix protein